MGTGAPATVAPMGVCKLLTAANKMDERTAAAGKLARKLARKLPEIGGEWDAKAVMAACAADCEEGRKSESGRRDRAPSARGGGCKNLARPPLARGRHHTRHGTPKRARERH